MTELYSVLRNWEENGNNPIISPPFPSPLIADPTFSPPKKRGDIWHLFAHSVMPNTSLFNILHYVSHDGFNWKRVPGIVMRSALRPYLFFEKEQIFLLYERIVRFLPFYFSQIEVITSFDFYHWTRPVTILTPSLDWHKYNDKALTVSNPCLIKEKDVYRLYYSAGLVYLKDCRFYEPLYIGCAISKNILTPFSPSDAPVISPNFDDRWLNLGAGSMKVIKIKDEFFGFQNGIYWNFESNHSGSAIRVWVSLDGYDWRLLSNDPIIKPEGNGWKRTHVYANDVREVDGNYVMYFNARSGWLFGRERIGRADSINF